MTATHRHHRGQQRIRFANDRQVIELMRQHQALSKVEISTRTGLSAQAAAQVIARLEDQRLVVRGASRQRLAGRGKGQPRVPYMLNPDGAYSLGLKIGRQQMDLTLVNLCGEVIGFHSSVAQAPDIVQLQEFLAAAMAVVCASLSPAQRQRICGVGVAMPYFAGQWTNPATVPDPVAKPALYEDPAELNRWLREYFALPVVISNDDNAACVAELFCSNRTVHSHFAYFFIGTFIGGAVVIDGALHAGSTGNAGAMASLPVTGPHGQLAQLHELASVYGLKQQLGQHHWHQVRHSQGPEPAWQDKVQQWIEQAAKAIAQASVALQAVLDTKTMIIDGIVPGWLLHALVSAINHHLKGQDWRGIHPITAEPGGVGAQAQALGCAHLPLLEHTYLL